MTQKKKYFLLFTFLVGGFMVLPVLHIRRKHSTFEPYTGDVKFVLYWTPFWNQKDYFLGYGFNPFKNCEYKNCYATANRTHIPLENFDALIFHASYNKNTHGVPWIRKSHQKYIFMNLEAPVHINPDVKKYDSYFNWTMTYRFDSDIVSRHGYIIQGKTNYTMPSKEFLNKKTKLAAWFVSNCRTPSQREILGKEIQKIIPVDVYGACGNLTCKRLAHNNKVSSNECYDMLEQNYKFYFSFENSYCKDYSTEKLYRLLQRDIVPVVYGAGDYRLSAPPNSVINVEDFNRVEDLADYLKYLAEHMGEYLKYFEWKKEYSVTTSGLPSACQICQKIQEPLKNSVYDDLYKWLWGENKSICKLSRALPQIVSHLLQQKNV